MRVALVAMPWQGLETASLPVGLLKSCLTQWRPGRHDVADYHANLDWADMLLERSHGAIGPDDYDYVANVGVWHAIGDWVFAGALYRDPDWRARELTDYLARRGVSPGKSAMMRPHADDFVDHAVHRILAGEPDVVGFTTTFSQNASSLAAARRLKERRPDVPIVFGGGNCDGPMGAALHRNFPWIDFVVSGEGERAAVALVDALAGEAGFAAVPGLIWRDGDTTRVNPPGAAIPMTDVPLPDYRDWQAAFVSSSVGSRVRPTLTMEAARGCWWGEKHHCTFCGLNGTGMAFRAKPAAIFLDDLHTMVARHGIRDVIMVDNIMSNDYFTELLPHLRELDEGLHIRYEVKANLRSRQLADLAAAGIRHIQPGIESLSTSVLGLMRKGVHATQNVQVLRDAEDHGLTVDWNMLYGFPGETDDDYRPVLAQLPDLVHLQPPAGATRILLERFSPYFDRPELGFPRRRPAEQYDHVYDLDDAALRDLAYQFESDPRGLCGAPERELLAAVATWQRDAAGSSLVQYRHPGGLRVHDRRAGRPERVHLVGQPQVLAVLEHCRTARSTAAVHDVVARTADGDWTTDDVLAHLRSRGLIFEEGGRVVALATADPAS